MSLLSWFSAKKNDPPMSSMLHSSGLSRIDSTKPFHAGARGLQGTAQPANRKQERLERRELLYAVVRECMVRSGVLSSSYKFKVLSLDPRGRQFMVMVDLAYGGGADTNRLAEIEAMVAQTAKSRHDILVSAVYWRANEHVAVGDPAHRPPISRPAPLTELPRPPEVKPAAPAAAARPAPVNFEATQPISRQFAATQAMAAQPAAARVDPLQAEEVEAFKKALAAGVRGEQALAAARPGQPQVHVQGNSYTLLTGFEDTELVEGDGDEDDHLSETQHGALR